MAQKNRPQATKTKHYRTYTVKEHQRKMYARIYKASVQWMRSRRRKEQLCSMLS